jgi:glycosyltransferase involved in cell wall biosynthesis
VRKLESRWGSFLKIALVTDTYFPRINGVSASTRVFFEEFQKLGHDVHVYAPAFPNHVDENPNIHRFPSSRIFFDPEDRLGRPNRDKALIQASSSTIVTISCTPRHRSPWADRR